LGSGCGVHLGLKLFDFFVGEDLKEHFLIHLESLAMAHLEAKRRLDQELAEPRPLARP
jgi:hypothetical protein